MPDFPEAIAAAVTSAIEKTFGSICGETPVRNGDKQLASGSHGVVGIISFVGDPVWSLSLAMPEKTATQLALCFAGFEIPFDSPDMGDVVGELANVLAGDVVAQLDSRGIKAQMSLPTVARGTDIELMMPGGAPVAKVNFSSAQGDFWCKLAAAKDGKIIGRKSGG